MTTQNPLAVTFLINSLLSGEIDSSTNMFFFLLRLWIRRSKSASTMSLTLSIVTIILNVFFPYECETAELKSFVIKKMEK